MIKHYEDYTSEVITDSHIHVHTKKENLFMKTSKPLKTYLWGINLKFINFFNILTDKEFIISEFFTGNSNRFS